jgi:cytochrome c551/c552
MCAILPRAMIKVLAAAVVGTVAGIVVMVVVIALSGTSTSGANDSVGFGSVTVPGGSTSATMNTTGSGGTEPSGSGSTGGSTAGGSGGASGNAANGETLFSEKSCSGCHAIEKGQPSPVGPNLADLKLDEATILHQIKVGGGPMPAGLAQGQDAKDIAAYVLQQEQ